MEKWWLNTFINSVLWLADATHYIPREQISEHQTPRAEAFAHMVLKFLSEKNSSTLQDITHVQKIIAAFSQITVKERVAAGLVIRDGIQSEPEVKKKPAKKKSGPPNHNKHSLKAKRR
jgi:hypothetical protein